MRIFFATDFHGSDICFKKFLRCADFYGVDALFMGGDFTSKSMLFCIKSKGIYRCTIGANKYILQSSAEFAEFRQNCWNKGMLVRVVTNDEYENIKTDIKSKNILYEDTLRNYLKRWTEVAYKHLKDKNVLIYYIPGNDEPLFCDEFFTEKPFVPLDRKLIQVNDSFEILGIGGSNITPWNTYREYEEDMIYRFIEETFNQANEHLPVMFFIHVPPYNSGLDRAPALNADFSYKLILGSPQMQPVGSKAVYKAIKRYKPFLGLFGHVHDCRGIVQVDETICINPGSTYTTGHLQGCIVTITKGHIDDIQLTEG